LPTEFAPNPHEFEAKTVATTICTECARRFRYARGSQAPAECPICDPGRGMKARLCEYCHFPFAMLETENFRCCSTSCDSLLAVGPADARNLHPPVQPEDAIPPVVPELGDDERICIDCGADFTPMFGRGLPGRSGVRIRCYRCSPSNLT